MRSDRSTLNTRIELLEAENARLRNENARLRKAAADLHWMARRYATGRSSYAVSLHNDATRTLLEMGVKLNPTGDGTLWAMDGMRSDVAFNELDDAYFEPGHPLATGQVLGLLPHHHLSRDLEAVLGCDPLAAIAKFQAAMNVVQEVRQTFLSPGTEKLREALAALKIIEEAEK